MSTRIELNDLPLITVYSINMAKIHQLTIKNFRSLKNFSQMFASDFVCLIGRGDSGKSSILEAISSILSSSWNLQFFDNDFYNCNTAEPIEIEATLTEIPEELLREDKYGLFQRGLTKTNGIIDDIEDDHQPVLTIRLTVEKDLEPKWTVFTEREIGSKSISAHDRAKLNTAMVSDYIDRHFAWSKGSPLYTLLQQEEPDEDTDGTHMIDALRDAKGKIDVGSFSKFDTAVSKVKAVAATFGINISKASTTIDFRDIVTKDGKVCLHDEKIPFRLKGKGSKRVISIAIQSAIAETGGIALIDEIEQGLEPDRVQQLINSLKMHTHGQVFITTHSRDVLVELAVENIFLMREGAKSLVSFDDKFQGTLRRHPEAFFAKAIILCEGATEIGIGRALNDFRIATGAKNMSYMGVRLANGEGTSIAEYAANLKASGFPLCLFCDSDDATLNGQKASLSTSGIQIIDWDNGDCLETAIMREIPFDMLKEAFELAVTVKCEEDETLVLDDVKKSMWDSIKAQFGAGCVASIDIATDSSQLRLAIGKAAAKNRWFKKQYRGHRLGELIFSHFDQLPEGKLKQQLTALSAWIDKNGS